MTSAILTDAHRQRAAHLKLHGLIAHWEELPADQHPTIARLLEWEEHERGQRGLDRRLRNARLGDFKALADFDWRWPKRIDRKAITELMQGHFIKDASNIVLLGGNGVGKTTIAKNIAHQCVLAGHSALFTTAADLLNTLGAQDGTRALQRKLRHYANPELLVIDEVGYLSYASHQADLLFEIISQRYESRSTLITTNRPFAEWSDVFPNAACVTSLIDRLVHHCDILAIECESWRMKQSKERAKRRTSARAKAKPQSEGENG